MLIDAHCHLGNLATVFDVNDLLSEAYENGITKFISTALSQSEIKWHLENRHHLVLWQAGIHPNYPECDIKLNHLEKLLRSHELWGIGEIGLDRNNPDLQWQLKVFNQQLELADYFGQLVILHLVGHPQEALKLMRMYDLKYHIHGFAGSVESFQDYCKLGCRFTISSRLLKPDKHDLLKAMLSYGKIMFETDMTAFYVKDSTVNPLLQLIGLVENTARISGIGVSELLSMQEAVYYDDYENHTIPW